MPNHLLRLSIILILSGLIISCAGMPISSMLKLRNLEPQDMDPSSLGIAVITHKSVRLADGSANLVVSYSSSEMAHNFTTKIYANVMENPEIKILQGKTTTDEVVTLFHLDVKEAEKLQIAINKIQAIKQLDIEGAGSLSVNINRVCLGPSRPEKLLADIYVKFNSELGYVLMNSGMDLDKLARDSNSELFDPKCNASKTKQVKLIENRLVENSSNIS